METREIPNCPLCGQHFDWIEGVAPHFEKEHPKVWSLIELVLEKKAIPGVDLLEDEEKKR